ncbi:hypothetical protein KL951_004775 [Ogataea haglerorum]|nr:hypothetical protein KL951_004775 [Ogataea haglerorum]
MSTLANQGAIQQRSHSRGNGSQGRGSSSGQARIPHNPGRNGHINRGGGRGRGGLKKTRQFPRVDKASAGASAMNDADLGPLIENPEQYGYTKMEHRTQGIPKYLLKEQVLFSCDSYVTNEWDANNQKLMLQKEAEHNGDYQSLFEEFQELRKEERKKMEQMNLVDVENAKKSLNDAIIFRGSCTDMCPTYERVERAFKNQVSKWEKDPATGKISRDYAVKTFMRPSGQPPSLPSDVRTPSVLVQTLDYLIERLLPKLPESQSFIWDRTRSIRQDFTLQNNYSGPEAIDCHEKICRIHILSSHVMAQANDPDYQQQQEIEQFNNSLQSLTHMYDDVRLRGGSCPNEPEFRAYELISKLKDTELDRNIQKLPAVILNSGIVQKALMLRGLIINGFGNFQMFVEFFRVIMDPSTPLLLSCLCEIHFNQVRHMAMVTMAKAYHSKSKKMPEASVLADWLGFDSVDQLVTSCKFYDIPIINDDNTLRVEVTALRQAFKSYQKPPSCSKLNYKMEHISYQQIVKSGLPNTEIKVSAETTFVPSQTSQPSKQIFQFVPPQSEPAKSANPPEIEKIEMLPNRSTSTKPKSAFPLASSLPFVQTQQQQKSASIAPSEPPTPVEPPKPQRKLINNPEFEAAAKMVIDNLLYDAVRKETETIVKNLAEVENQRRIQHHNQIVDSLKTELFVAFMREQMYIIAIDVKARLFRERNLKRRILRRIKAGADRLVVKHSAKKSKLNEIHSFANKVRPEFLLPAHVSSWKFSVSPPALKKKNGFEEDNVSCLADLLPYVNQQLRMLVIVDTWDDAVAKWLSNKLSLKEAVESGKLVKTAKLETAKGAITISSIPDRFRSRVVFKNVNLLLIKIEYPTSHDLTTSKQVLAKVIEYLSRFNREEPVTLMLVLVDFPREIDLISKPPPWLTVRSINLNGRMSPLTLQNKFHQFFKDCIENYHSSSSSLQDAETTLMSRYTTIENSLVGLLRDDLSNRHKLDYIRSLAGKRKASYDSEISLITEETPPSGNFEFCRTSTPSLDISKSKKQKIDALLELSESVLKR